MIDLEKLEELAKAATPGPWTSHEKGFHPSPYVCAQAETHEYGEDASVVSYAVGVGADANAAFIAAANPATILELLAEIERLREALAPFAKNAKAWGDYPDNENLVEPFNGMPESVADLTVGDLRRAAALIREE